MNNSFFIFLLAVIAVVIIFFSFLIFSDRPAYAPFPDPAPQTQTSPNNNVPDVSGSGEKG